MDEIESWRPKLLPEELRDAFTSILDIRCIGDNGDAIAVKRLLQAIAATLAFNGTSFVFACLFVCLFMSSKLHLGSGGVYTVLRRVEVEKLRVLQRLGFVELATDEEEGLFFYGHAL